MDRRPALPGRQAGQFLQGAACAGKARRHHSVACTNRGSISSPFPAVDPALSARTAANLTARSANAKKGSQVHAHEPSLRVDLLDRIPRSILHSALCALTSDFVPQPARACFRAGDDMPGAEDALVDQLVDVGGADERVTHAMLVEYRPERRSHSRRAFWQSAGGEVSPLTCRS